MCTGYYFSGSFNMAKNLILRDYNKSFRSYQIIKTGWLVKMEVINSLNIKRKKEE